MQLKVFICNYVPILTCFSHQEPLQKSELIDKVCFYLCDADSFVNFSGNVGKVGLSLVSI